MAGTSHSYFGISPPSPATTHWAGWGTTTGTTANIPPSGTEAIQADYTALVSSDDNNWLSTAAAGSGAKAVQYFRFRQDNVPTELLGSYEGFGGNGVIGWATEFARFNFSTSQWELAGRHTGAADDILTSLVSSGAADYVSGNYAWFYAMCPNAATPGANSPISSDRLFLGATWADPTTLDQTHYRFFGDGAGLNAALASAVEDATVETTKNNIRRLRVGVHGGGGIAGVNIARRLQWRASGGSWANVDTSATQPIFLSDSAQFVDADATTERLTAGGKTFEAGQGKDTANDTSSVNIVDTEKVEDEWCLRAGNESVEGTTYEFRVVYNDGTPLDTYSVTPQWKVVAGQRASTTLTHIRIAQEQSMGVQKASPAWLYPWAYSADIVPNRGAIQTRHLTGDRFIRQPVPGQFSAGGRVGLLVGPENMHTILYGLLSAVSTTSPAAGVYEHSFNVGSTQPTWELQADKVYTETWCQGGLIQAATFAVAPNNFLTAEVDWEFQGEIPITAGTMPTPTYSALLPFRDSPGSLERDDGVVADMNGFTLAMRLNPHPFRPAGEASTTDAVPGKHECNWALVCAFADDTEYRRFLGDSTGSGHQTVADRFQSVKLEWEFQTGENVAAGYPYSLKFTAYGALYLNFPEPLGSDSELLMSTPTAIVAFEAGSGKTIEAVLRNSLTNSSVVT